MDEFSAKSRFTEETNDGLYEKQKYERRYEKRQISLAFGEAWTVIDSNNILFIISVGYKPEGIRSRQELKLR